MYNLGGRLSEMNTTDWSNETTPVTQLPPTLNWTAAGWVTPVLNQVFTPLRSANRTQNFIIGAIRTHGGPNRVSTDPLILIVAL